MKQRNLSFMLTMLMSMIGITTSAHDIEVKNSDGVTIYYVWTNNQTELAVSFRGSEYGSFSREYSGNVVIPESVIYNGKSYSVTSIDKYAFFECQGLTSVTIPNSVTSIGEYAFGYTGLTSVSIPESVTSIVNHAFLGCKRLTSVTIHSKAIVSNTYTSDSNMNSIFGTQVQEYILGEGVESIGDYAFCKCTNMVSVAIPNSVTSIGNEAFYECTGLTSVTIPNSVTNIGTGVFIGCNGLTSVTIPESVTSIGMYAFSGCKGLKSVSISNGVTSIDSKAFNGCLRLTSVTIPESVTSIGNDAFTGCSDLNSVILNSNAIVSHTYTSSWNLQNLFGSQVKEYILGEKVTSIGNYTFYSCTGLTSVTIPNSVTSIGESAFYKCTGLISVHISSLASWCRISFDGSSSNPFYYAHYLFLNNEEIKDLVIPEGVTRIGEYTFYGCTDLTSVIIPNSVTSIGNYAFSRCTGLTAVTIPESVTSIDRSAFDNCTGLTAVTIPENVTSIDRSAFDNCTGLTAVHISNLATWCGISFGNYSSNPLYYAHHLFLNNEEIKELIIPNNVTSISKFVFDGCAGLTSVTIPEEVTSIGEYAFSGCTGLTSVILNSNIIASNSYSYESNLSHSFGTQVKEITFGNEVTSIGNYACYGFNQLSSVTLHDNIKFIGYNAFLSKILVNKGSKTLLACWKSSYKPYSKETSEEILPPAINVEKTTQTTATVKIDNWCDGYTYLYNDENITSAEYTHTKQKPESTQQLTLDVSLDDVHYTTKGEFTTKGLQPTIGSYEATASSLLAVGTFTEEDAKVVGHRIAFNGSEPIEGNQVFSYGLNPGSSYNVQYTIDVDYGGPETATYTGTSKIYTKSIVFKTDQPKVVSMGNVVVSATTNLDERETNVGMEWRRTDWTDEFPSNMGLAYLYNGVIEGCIYNLNTDKLWKVRPYYQADNGRRFYGEWMGVDPTNTSYFEPTVHTDSRISVKDNTAEVRGYAIQGTDQVTKQGFMYWKASQTSRTEGERHAAAVPADALSVEADGLVMTVALTNLEYDTDYYLTAFVTTANGKTFYGEQQSFKTGSNTEGVEEQQTMPKVMEEMRYDLNGHRLDTPHKGLNIIRMSDGTIKKIVVK